MTACLHRVQRNIAFAFSRLKALSSKPIDLNSHLKKLDSSFSLLEVLFRQIRDARKFKYEDPEMDDTVQPAIGQNNGIDCGAFVCMVCTQ